MDESAERLRDHFVVDAAGDDGNVNFGELAKKALERTNQARTY